MTNTNKQILKAFNFDNENDLMDYIYKNYEPIDEILIDPIKILNIYFAKGFIIKIRITLNVKEKLDLIACYDEIKTKEYLENKIESDKKLLKQAKDSEFKRQYLSNEDNNQHVDNVLLCCDYFGLDTEAQKVRLINRLHELYGYLPDELYKLRNKITDSFNKKLDEILNDNSI